MGVELSLGTSEGPRTFTVFRRKISITAILAFLVLLLIATNLYSMTRVNWYSERFKENVARTQNGFQNLLSDFNDILSDGSLDEKSVRELEVLVEKTSIHSATVTYRARASTPSLLILLSLFWGTVITALTLGWDHLETKALYLISQEMKLEIALIHQREDEVPIELLLDQQVGSIEIEQKNDRMR